MATISDVVKVHITRSTNQVTIANLNTIAILSQHSRFGDDYRIYNTPADMLEDGFVVGDFAYKAALIAFKQDPAPSQLVIGKMASYGGTYVDGDYTDAINDLTAAYNQWEFLITDATDEDAILEVAGLIEASEKFHVLFTNEAGVLTSGTTDIASQIKALGYERTLMMFNENTNSTVPAAGWAGRFAGKQLGSTLWIYKPVVGILTSNLSTTQETNLKAKNVNWYANVDGNSMMFGDNKVAGGEYIDVMLGVQWVITRMRERVFGAVTTYDKLNMDTGGVAVVEAAVRAVCQEAVDIGIFTKDVPITIIVPNVLNWSSAQRATRNLSGITFKAQLAGAIQYVDGIEGTVYA